MYFVSDDKNKGDQSYKSYIPSVVLEPLCSEVLDHPDLLQFNPHQ